MKTDITILFVCLNLVPAAFLIAGLTHPALIAALTIEPMFFGGLLVAWLAGRE
jgi:hypothetical protein